MPVVEDREEVTKTHYNGKPSRLYNPPQQLTNKAHLDASILVG